MQTKTQQFSYSLCFSRKCCATPTNLSTTCSQKLTPLSPDNPANPSPFHLCLPSPITIGFDNTGWGFLPSSPKGLGVVRWSWQFAYGHLGFQQSLPIFINLQEPTPDQFQGVQRLFFEHYCISPFPNSPQTKSHHLEDLIHLIHLSKLLEQPFPTTKEIFSLYPMRI